MTPGYGLLLNQAIELGICINDNGKSKWLFCRLVGKLISLKVVFFSILYVFCILNMSVGILF